MAITVNDLKKLSPQAKALIVILVVFIIGYLYYFYFLSDVLTKKATLEKDLESIRAQITQKEKIVLQYDKYKAEVAALEENYKVALLKLPDQRKFGTFSFPLPWRAETPILNSFYLSRKLLWLKRWSRRSWKHRRFQRC